MKYFLIIAVLATTGTCRNVPDEVKSEYTNIKTLVTNLLNEFKRISPPPLNANVKAVIRHNIAMQDSYQKFLENATYSICKETPNKCMNLDGQANIVKMCLYIDPIVTNELTVYNNFVECNFNNITLLLKLYERSRELIYDLQSSLEKIDTIIDDGITTENSATLIITQVQQILETEKKMVIANIKQINQMMGEIRPNPPRFCNEYLGQHKLDYGWFSREIVQSCIKSYLLV